MLFLQLPVKCSWNWLQRTLRTSWSTGLLACLLWTVRMSSNDEKFPVNSSLFSPCSFPPLLLCRMFVRDGTQILGMVGQSSTIDLYSWPLIIRGFCVPGVCVISKVNYWAQWASFCSCSCSFKWIEHFTDHKGRDELRGAQIFELFLCRLCINIGQKNLLALATQKEYAVQNQWNSWT